MQLSSGLLYAGRQWQRLADSRLGSYGISTACTMPLLMIGRSGGGIRQVALAQQLGMEGPSWYACWTSCVPVAWSAARATPATAAPICCG